ncbi:FtsK/SpoIIIE domain-containing protein [Thermomonospora cellulosilytica]|uniref:FtsK domain-containing protein n=1 Tax=Thermomonospora cellulosilytica TaxID=1411118 RepID=A0A7W3MU92_9ACTN|nr:FtsK/SpoIIIE domain-containing protein [Thermomonospora cellulosilytica]MBA9001991.1 hypothetical protein [Thermomonospora cellulosilytica]
MTDTTIDRHAITENLMPPGTNTRPRYGRIAELEHSELGLETHGDPLVRLACRTCNPLPKRAARLAQMTARGVVVPAFRYGRVHAGYAVLGTVRAARAGWRWVTAAELSQHLGARPEMVVRERARRRRVAAWAGGIVAAVVVLLVVVAPGLAVLLLVVILGAVAAVEGRLRRVETEGSDGRGIGTHPSGRAVRAAVAAAKLGKTEDIRVIGPVARDADRAWTAVVELPAGVTAEQARKRQPALASAFGVDLAQLAVDPVRGHTGRVTLWCADADPLSGASIPSPLPERAGAFDVWHEKVAVGVDVRGRPVAFALPERSILTGGEPGAGKSVGCHNVLGAVALDPRVPLWIADGKGGADLMDYEPIAARFLPDPDPAAMLEMIRDAQDDMADRYRRLRAIGAKKLTGDVAAQLGIELSVFHIDELQFFAASDLGKEIVNGLWDLVSRGRAAGWVVSVATQRPSGDVIPTKLRDILSIRWALRCTTPEASDTILGRGWAGQGYSAHRIDSTQRGAGLLLAEGSMPVAMRTYLIGDRDVTALTRRAYRLREQAGTLPKSDARPGVRLLKAILTVMGQAEKVPTTLLLEKLPMLGPFEGWDATRLADELRPLGVRPADQWIDGRNQRGYRRADVERAFERA